MLTFSAFLYKQLVLLKSVILSYQYKKKKALFFSIKNILKVWNCQKPWQNKEINNNILFAVKDKIFILEYDQNYIFRNT